MPVNAIFLIDMGLGYLASALFLAAYVWPRLKAMDPVSAQRAIATLHSFRFFGLVFLLPGFVGPDLPRDFAMPAAFGDLAAAVLAILALLALRVRTVFWPLIWGFNLVGLADLVLDTFRAASLGVPSVAGQLGAAYAIPMLYVPTLFWTHLLALRLLTRPVRSASQATGTDGAPDSRPANRVGALS